MMSNAYKPATHGDALDMGYTVYDITWCRGYVSRTTDMARQPVRIAGGSRKGELYVYAPSQQSTAYCLRWYIRRQS